MRVHLLPIFNPKMSLLLRIHVIQKFVLDFIVSAQSTDFAIETSPLFHKETTVSVFQRRATLFDCNCPALTMYTNSFP